MLDNYTPAKLMLYCRLIQKRRRRQRAEELSIAAQASRNKAESINAQIKDWSR